MYVINPLALPQYTKSLSTIPLSQYSNSQFQHMLLTLASAKFIIISCVILLMRSALRSSDQKARDPKSRILEVISACLA
jgi:hypothetical protein